MPVGCKRRFYFLPVLAGIMLFVSVRCTSEDEMKIAGKQSLFQPGALPKKVASGFAFTEGPTPDADGNVYFTDQPNDRIMIWRTDGTLAVFMQPAGRSNGMSFDKNGVLYACADGKNELWAIDRQKKVTVLVRDYNGRLLNGPNDVWVHPAGDLYLTDPFYRRSYWERGPSEQDCEGVYRLDADRKTLTRVTDDLVQPNGIVGTLDGRTLYVADIGDAKTFVYHIEPDGSLSGKRLFCTLGSDGMTIDENGNLYLTGRGVTVVDASGSIRDHIPIPEPWTSNVCFGNYDMKTLFITASSGLYALPMLVKGIE